MTAIPDGTGTPTQDELAEMLQRARADRDFGAQELKDAVLTARAYGMTFAQMITHSKLSSDTVQRIIRKSKIDADKSGNRQL
jgi:hypothetical protein